MIVYDENIDKFIELKRNIESTLAKVDHRLELIEKTKNQESVLENLTLGNIAHISLRYSGTTRAPPEYDDLTGKDLSKRPSYRFPCPSIAHIQLSQLNNAKQLPCLKPRIKLIEISPSSKRIEITSIQKNVDIIYQLNGSKEQIYSEPIYVEGLGSYLIKAFSCKPGFYNSAPAEQSFCIQEYEPNYGSEISSRDVLGSFHDLDNSTSYEAHQQATNSHESHAHRHSTHSHSKYRGLHLISNQSDSDSSDPE
ncbi:Chitobiase/beta-hexosaminidase C-terminal domain protein [Cryptosporidium meleagridis]|uniref:Chitobiase/beta-hexosaminidase C-terminal domain protein n=1 Tax=Cryptosporidium meleagridis TaxID=93969 RepID=A0A2P4YY59_9CRYT|nr:Chitobiase/beta-hexosaminidase C-terminal domain protein [Cryptosporidium meleagridis]